MKKISIIYKIICIIICFTMIQIPQVYATSTDVSYVAGRFAWDLAEMLKNRQDEMSVPPEVYKNDLLDECLKAATEVYPFGETLIKSIRYSGITKTLSVEYIDKNAYVFIGETKEDLIEVRSLANKLNLSSYLIAFPTKIEVTSFQEIESIDPLIEFNADEVVVSSYDKSASSLGDYVWKYPLVFYFDIKKGETEEDKILVNNWVINSVKNINPYSSVKDKVKAVNAILTSTFEYDLNVSEEDIKPHLASHMIKTRKGVCSAYALLGYQMLTTLGVETKVVTGHDTTMTEAHAWLMVKDENGSWYYFDPTWNDPVPDEKGRVDTTFLYLTDMELSTTHIWEKNNYTPQKLTTDLYTMHRFNNPTIILKIDDPTLKINNVTTTVDANPTVVPIIINSSTYLPLRTLVEVLGGTIEWNDTTKTVTIIIGSNIIQITIDAPTASLNGRIVPLIAPATILNGRTLLPLRSVMELLGKTVNWDNDTRTITIN